MVVERTKYFTSIVCRALHKGVIKLFLGLVILSLLLPSGKEISGEVTRIINSDGKTNQTVFVDLDNNLMIENPIIDNVNRLPLFPGFEDDVLVTATVNTQDNGLTVILKYDAGIGFQNITMHDDGLNNDETAGDNIFVGLIPAHTAGIIVHWYIEAFDDTQLFSYFPEGGQFDALSYRVTDWTPTAIFELPFPEPSGLTFNANTGTLFSNNDGPESDIYEISSTGELLSIIDVNGSDFEGITFDEDSGIIYVVEEENWLVKSYTVDGNYLSGFEVQHNPESSSGLEGIVFNPSNDHLYVLHESDPSELIELTIDGVEINRVELDFSPDVSGLTIHSEWQTLLVVSDEGYSLNEITPQGDFLRSWYIPIDQVEGVTFGATSDVIFMVADQGNKLYEFSFYFDSISYAPELFINEVLASNDTGWQDPDNLDGDPFDDWVELYNPNEFAVNVGGMFIADSHLELHMIPVGTSDTVIPSYGYLLLYLDNEPIDGPLHIPENLAGSGDGIYLYATDGITIIDSLVFGEQLTDISFGLFPDGSDNLIFFHNPSPGTSNFSVIPELVINEFLAVNNTVLIDTDELNGDPYDDWVEIYNAGNESMNLAGMYFDDNHEILHQVPAGFPETIVESGEYKIVWFDNEPDEGPLHIPEKLAASGDSIFLYDINSMDLLNFHLFGTQSADISEGRFPNGSETWQLFESPTPGSENVLECENDGDANIDGAVDILDIVIIVGYIIDSVELTPDGLCHSDITNDGTIDILDIVTVVAMILD